MYQEKIKEMDSKSILRAKENRGMVAGVTITKPLQALTVTNISDDDEEMDDKGNNDFDCESHQVVDHSDKSDPKQLIQPSETNENSKEGKKMEDIREVEIDESYNPTYNLPNQAISISHIDISWQQDRSNVALNMDEETDKQRQICGNKKKIIIVCVSVSVIVIELIVSLSLTLKYCISL